MSDNSEQSNVESSESETGDDSDGMEIVSGHVQPYQDEPLAEPNAVEEETIDDEDGIAPAILEARFEGEIPVDNW